LKDGNERSCPSADTLAVLWSISRNESAVLTAIIQAGLNLWSHSSINWIYLSVSGVLLLSVALAGAVRSASPEKRRLISVIWKILLCILLALVAVDFIQGIRPLGDYRAYYVGGLAISRGVDLGDRPALEELAEANGITQRFTGLNYPPFWYLVCAPATAFPPGTFFRLTLVLNLLLIPVLVYFSLKLMDGPRMTPFVFAGALMLVMMSYPVRLTVNEGQVNILIALLLALFIFWDDRRNFSLSGISLGLAIGIKLIPALLVLPLILMRRWRTLLWAATSTLLTVVLSAPFAGISGVWDYFAHGGYMRNIGSLSAQLKQSVVAVSSRVWEYTGLGSSGIWTSAGYLLSLLCLVWALTLTLRRRSRAIPVLGLWILAMLLCSPHSYLHHLAILAPASFITAGMALRSGNRTSMALLLAGWLMANADYGFWMLGGDSVIDLVAGNLFFWGLLLIFAVHSWLLLKETGCGPAGAAEHSFT
jgi:alpha-1,2-mannosyltransferase